MKKQSNLGNISDGVLCEEILKSMPDLITVVDKDFILIKVINANSGNSFFPSSMLPGRHVSENLDTEKFVNIPSLRPSENQQFIVNPIFDGIKECFNTGNTIEKEYATYLNGELHYFEGRYKKINDNYVVCIERNITKRKRAEIIVDKSRMAFSEVMNTMPIPVFIKDINNDLKYIFWNNSSQKELGHLASDVIGKTDVEIYGAERGGAYTEIDKHVIEKNELYQFEDCYETPDGKKYTYLSHKMVVKNDIINWLLTARWDITGLIKAQNELEEANKQLEIALALTSSVPLIWDIERDIIQLKFKEFRENNIEFVQDHTGVSLSEHISHIHPDDREYALQAIRKMKSGETDTIHRIIRYDSTGQYKSYYEIFLTVTKRDKKNFPVQAIGSLRDITAQQKAAKELQEAKEAAEASDRLKSEFISNMSHEIRTPLNAIIGFSELIVNAKTQEEKRDYLSVIKNNNELLLQLINDILDLSKIEANILEFVYSNINVNEQLKQIEAISNRKIGNSKNVVVTFTPLLEKCIIRTEKNRFRQVMLNLVNNAIKFTQEGSINIGYKVIDNSIKFFVSDTGMGIAEEKKKEIFKRFVKLNNFIAGTGLGLSISQTIIQKLGGEIGVDSIEGQGSTFWFTLPVLPIENGMSEEEKLYFDSALKINTGNTITGTIDKPTLLVAEDSPDNYKLFFKFLEGQYDIIHAWDGEEAVKLYDKHSEEIETIVMDIKMPVIDGYEATRKIRERDQETPILAVSAYAFPEDVKRMMNSGFDCYLPKPVRKKELIDTIRSLKRKN